MDHNSNDFAGARVVVTGAGTGIGRGVAMAFAAAGAKVALHYSHSSEGARSAVQQIRDAGGKAECFAADFRQPDAAPTLIEEAVEYLGGIDVLINNAGITANKPFEEVTVNQFDTLFGVNIRSMFFATQAATRLMSEAGRGAVVNLTSVHAYAAMTEHTVYAATKGAIVAFTRVAGLELAQRGVRVNAIAPGWIFVESHRKAMPDLDPQAEGRKIPAGFIGNPDDVAEMAMFLASDRARYIVGQTFVVDGGQLAIMPLTGDFRERRDSVFGEDYVR